jgi:hypothetical protein
MMRIIRSRGYGKTWDLIDYAVKNDAIIVCPMQAHVNHIKNMALEKGKEVEIATVNEMLNGELKGRRKKMVFDELEICMIMILLRYGCGEWIGYSMSME